MASYNDYIVSAIIANKDYNIDQVNNLEDVVYVIFDKEQYPSICTLIKEQNWGLIKAIEVKPATFREYLSIQRFYDQYKKEFVVTSYDSDELLQNPEVLDIFSI